MSRDALIVRTGEGFSSANRLVEQLVTDRVASRIFARDATLWGPEAEAEASIRLGWTDPFERATELIAETTALRKQLLERGISRVVLCGMGGSSLGPEVLAAWSGAAITLLDSTHPDTVRRVTSQLLAETVVVVSSKSGSTVETRSQLAAFEAAYVAADLPATDHIVVVTDPGSALESVAHSAGYACFLADPNIGGRFSVLAAFGIVPAVLAGVDMGTVLADAQRAQNQLAADDASNPALQLAAAIASVLPERYILTLQEAADARWQLGDWIEQLVAESTGKEGKGALPISLPPEAFEHRAAGLGNAARIRLSESRDTEADAGQILVSGPLGAQFLMWQTATAALGVLMGVDPFNQPDVESAKLAARAALEEAPQRLADEGTKVQPETLLARLREAVPAGGYLVLQAYLDREPDTSNELVTLRELIAQRLGVPVALGWGPRYLHSTGQFHKGGPALGAFLQVCDLAEPELEIRGSDSGFGALIRSQARGDRGVLQSNGRTVLTLDRSAIPEVIAELTEAPSR